MCIQRHPTVSFSKNLLYSLALLHDSPNANINVNNKRASIQLFYLLLFGLGFVLSVYYFTHLASYFMRPIFQPHMNNLEEIIDAGIDILATPRTYELLHSGKFSDIHAFDKITKTVPINSFMEIINSQFAYILPQEDWDLIDRAQIHLIQPKFKYSHMCFGNYYIAFPLKVHSLFAENLNDFLLRIKESGLWSHWEEESFYIALKTKLLQLLVDDYPAEPLDMQFFLLAWIVLFCGGTLSALCFIAEILFSKYSKKVH
uniref:Ionotropic glutamate receptor C-terminal domain-containing protein n=1 Tax=Glossina brevipalpis TaxID=37001 RepID=A0A1A9WV33_9MUSC